MTDDCELRIRAGLKLKKENSTLCYVGEETDVMKKYYSDEKIVELNNCNSTFGNIREIFQYAKGNDFDEITIVSNNYHLKRIKLFLKKYNLFWQTEGAEDILKVNPKNDFWELIKYPIDYFSKKLID